MIKIFTGMLQRYNYIYRSIVNIQVNDRLTNRIPVAISIIIFGNTLTNWH